MSGRKKLILIMLAVFIGAESCVVAYLARPLLPMLSRSLGSPTATPSATPTTTFTPTWTPIPTSTSTPVPTDTSLPTATATRVVRDTATRTPTGTYTRVLGTPPSGTPAATGTATRAARKRASTATPTPSYPFKLVESQVYTTSNHFFMAYAQIKIGGVLVAGYRIVGTHYPSEVTFESPLSCDFLCKASGATVSTTPCCNELCTPEAGSLPPHVQAGNVAFEAPIYETGTYVLRLIDPQGQQVSGALQVPIDINDRKWFYFVFNK